MTTVLASPPTPPNELSYSKEPAGPVYWSRFKGRPLQPLNQVPVSLWAPSCQPTVDATSDKVDAWFLDNWDFPDEKARRKFVAAGFSRVTCLYYPLAKDERIHFACELLTILFLIDDLLEDMSFEDGKVYNERLMILAENKDVPNKSIPVEWMFHDLWERMRACDLNLANEVLEPTFVFMRAQTDTIRKDISELGQYLEYREKDVGKALLSALMRFAMGLSLTADELASVKLVENNCAKHISIVNDIYSWEKEVKQSEVNASEGSVLCSAVKVLAENAGLSIEASKRALWSMVREWEVKHELLCSEPSISLKDCSEDKLLYLKGLEFQMSGNELWSRTTPRYLVIS